MSGPLYKYIIFNVKCAFNNNTNFFLFKTRTHSSVAAVFGQIFAQPASLRSPFRGYWCHLLGSPKPSSSSRLAPRLDKFLRGYDGNVEHPFINLDRLGQETERQKYYLAPSAST